MRVVRVYLWPRGDASKERVLSQATLALTEVDPSGRRSYDVRLWKDRAVGGPSASELREAPASKIWRRGRVGGHLPGGRGAAARGVWDLVGGALRVLLAERLDGYVRRTRPAADEQLSLLPTRERQ